MIYLKTPSQTYSLPERTSISQPMDYFSYHQPFTDLNYGFPLGLDSQELTVQLRPVDLLIPFNDVIYVSFDNVTWQKVITIKVIDFGLPFKGAHYPLALRIVASPLRLGSSHASGDKWGLASTTLAQSGNHTAYAKLVYYASRFYFSLMQNLIDFAGSSITFARASAKTYGGVSYPANTPIFDTGLYIGIDDVAKLDISNYASGTLLIKIKFKEGSDTTERDILKTLDFKLWLDETNQLIKLTKGANTLQCAYSNTDYEAGAIYLIGIKWNATNTYLAVAKWDSTNLTFQAASLVTTSGAWTIIFGMTYFGSSGTDKWMKDILSDFILYDYEVTGWTTAKYVLTLNPLRFNDFYISNKTAGIITYDEGKLTDEDDNDISGLVSGTLLEEGTIEMLEGLSAKWTAEVKDTYFL
jgi:hypothetical protein